MGTIWFASPLFEIANPIELLSVQIGGLISAWVCDQEGDPAVKVTRQSLEFETARR
jgi:hypothetical protein